MLSICIPTLNRAELLEKNLKYLLTFSKLKIEVCISNNCSSDDTQRVIDQYKSKFKKFNYITTPKTVDIMANFNLVHKLATQKYTIFCCDDDQVNETDLLKGIDLLEKDKELMGVFSGFRKYNSDNELLETLKFADTNEFYDLSNSHKLPSKFIALDLGIHRSDINKYLVNTHENFSSIGWDLIGILLSHGKICVSPYFFFNRLHHKEQYSNVHNNDPHLNDFYFSSVEIFLSRLNCSSNDKIQSFVNYKANFYRYKMWRNLKKNSLIQANLAINKGILYSPEAFSIFAKEWDQKHLLAAVIQYLNTEISTKLNLKRVLIYSLDPKKLDFLYAKVNEIIEITPIKIDKDSLTSSFDHQQDFVIFFEALDSLNLKIEKLNNSAIFMDIINALKFTKSEVKFQS
jgi:glycosyltransferase involved in cell wall biosynthesis